MLKFYNINPKILTNYLDIRVRKYCKKCKRYKKSGSCPPYVESIEKYKSLFLFANCAVLIVEKFIIDNPNNWRELGILSSECLRKNMYRLIEKMQWKECLVFGGGSCKNCIQCSIPCKNPSKRLIPVEGLGLNVINLVKDIANIELKFPVEKQGFFYRIGLIIYE